MNFNIEVIRFTAVCCLLVVFCLFPSHAYPQVLVIRSEEADANSGPLCGIYALAGAAKTLQHEFEYHDLLQKEFVGSDQGSSALELCRAAESIGLNAKSMKRMTIDSLRSSKVPLILHLNRSRHQTTSRHWILYLGDSNGKARVFDAPDPVALRNYADLLAEWDGIAISISPDVVDSRYSDFSRFGRPMGAILVIVVLLIVQFVALEGHKQSGRTSTISLILGVAVLANGVHWLAPDGIHRNPSSIALVSKYYFAANLPRVSTKELSAYVEQADTRSTVIVDARSRAAFNDGHIPGAMSLPVSSSPDQLATAVDVLRNAKRIIVYCQSAGCDWDEIIARHLVFSGLEEVCLYHGGWTEWQKARNEADE